MLAVIVPSNPTDTTKVDICTGARPIWLLSSIIRNQGAVLE